VAVVVGVCILVVGVVLTIAAWRWERRYSASHPERSRPNAAISGRSIPLILSLLVCGLGVRVALAEAGLLLWQRLVIGAGFVLLAVAVAAVFLRWMRGREKTDATRRVASRVLVAFVVLGVLGWGFV
jgi:membrane protein implicated in regulation of membrane protease activity